MASRRLQWPVLSGAWAAPLATSSVFSLGIASGDPTPDGVVLWTRLVTDPLRPDGGLAPVPLSVEWQLASDEAFGSVVQQGTSVARPHEAHSVHIDLRGLDPARWYWYRFRCNGEISPVGRTRTAPAESSSPSRFRLAFASCQNFEQGLFNAYRHLVEEELDLFVFLGDYIYEMAGTAPKKGGTKVRQHVGSETVTLDDYRQRHGQYRSDPALQAAHAAFPWVVTWDDHDVDNNYAADIPEDDQPRDAFLRRRAAAYQAFWEHMPLRYAQRPEGPDARLYRRLRFGDLLEMSVLDTRQYRDDQPCGGRFDCDCPERSAEPRTMMGEAQERWLLDGLTRSTSRWNVIAQQVMMAQADMGEGANRRFDVDAWDGYPVARDRLLGFLERRRPANPVVLTGDWHSNWAADLKADFRDERSRTVGTEFVCTSISSGGDVSPMTAREERALRRNPHLKFFNGQRGYVRCDITRQAWLTDFRVLDQVTRPESRVATQASFLVHDGVPGVQKLGL